MGKSINFETLLLTIYGAYSFNFFKLIVEDSKKKMYLDCIQLKPLFNEIRAEGKREGSYHLFYEELIH